MPMDRETPPRARGVDAVIFDLDGLLLDTEPAYRTATDALLLEHGATVDDALWHSCIGRPSIDAARVLVDQLRLAITAEEFIAARSVRMDEALRACEPMPGARAFVASLSAAGIPIAIATSSTPHSYARKTERHGVWLGGASTVVTSADVTRGKPEPDCYLEAARRLGVSPGRCVAFEDAPSGVAAARAAGMFVVAVPSVGVDVEACAAADLVLATLEDVTLASLYR